MLCVLCTFGPRRARVCTRANVPVRAREMRRPRWPPGDRGSNEDVWLFQNPSAGIFPPSFTPSVSAQHTSSHLFRHTHTHTHATTTTHHHFHYYSIVPELTNRRRALNPELQWPEPHFSPLNGGKTCVSALSCSGSLYRSLSSALVIPILSSASEEKDKDQLKNEAWSTGTYIYMYKPAVTMWFSLYIFRKLSFTLPVCFFAFFFESSSFMCHSLFMPPYLLRASG